MRIKMKISVSGTFENMIDGVNVGDIVDLPDQRAAHYCALHYAEPVVDRKEERAVAPIPVVEVRAAEVGAEVKPEPEPEPVPEPVQPKRGPGRPSVQK